MTIAQLRDEIAALLTPAVELTDRYEADEGRERYDLAEGVYGDLDDALRKLDRLAKLDPQG